MAFCRKDYSRRLKKEAPSRLFVTYGISGLALRFGVETNYSMGLRTLRQGLQGFPCFLEVLFAAWGYERDA